MSDDVRRTAGDRVRFPIALKLILASTALVLLLSAGFVVEGLVSTSKHFSNFAAAQREFEIKALSARGLATVRQLGDALYAPLLNGDIDLINDAVQSVAKGDAELVDARILRKDGRIVARSSAGSLGESVLAETLDQLKKLDAPTQLTAMAGNALPPRLAFGAPIQVKVGETTRREGYMTLEMSTERIAAVLKDIEAKRKQAVRSALIQTIIIGVAALLLGFLVAVFQGFRFSGAIRHLAHVAAEVGRGNLKARARPTTRDEIGVLSVRFNEMTDHVERLLVESMAKAALDKELERANSIQRMLMPPRERLTHAGLTYCGWSETATQMGGDWWHHYPIGKNKVLLVVGDVTGHGIPSAMLTATTKAACDTLLLDTESVDFPRFMRSLDHAIRESGKGELVMTLFAVLIDTEKKTVEFANAGHNFPLVAQKGDVKALIARGGRLGDGDSYASVKQPFEKGETIVLYTDGIVECENAEGTEYGMRRLRKMLQTNANEDVLKLRDSLLEDAHSFFGNQPPKDDITLVVCRL